MAIAFFIDKCMVLLGYKEGAIGERIGSCCFD